MKPTAKVNYLLWAARQWLTADRQCPGCQSDRTRLIKRKYAFTGLLRCDTCALMFRVPKGSLEDDGRFYQREYEQEFTTELPDDAHLELLKRNSFREIGKDYGAVIGILEALGLQAGSRVYDFGCSWGYASWQMRQHGFCVYSYELSGMRARFAQEKLGCDVLADARVVPQKVDCFFAAHVLEHLANPNALWSTAAAVLRPGGCLVLTMPNGEPSREAANQRSYHQLWGRVHPLLLTAAALEHMAKRYGFTGLAYSSPYDLDQIREGLPGELHGDELLFVARQTA